MSASHSHARARAQTRARRGFSLGEVMIALVVFGVIMSATFAFLLGQSKSFRSISAKSAAIQNGRFGRDVMRQELRTAGTNVTVDQPVIVFANDSTFAYNSDLTTNTKDSTGFTSAVYVDPFATNAQVSAIALANAITIPGSSPSFSYPLADYGGSGVSAEAELVVFRFTRDTASSNSLDYMLLRQINAGAAEVIATGLRRSQAVPFLRYWYDPTRYSVVLTALDTIPRSWLPLATFPRAITWRCIANASSKWPMCVGPSTMLRCSMRHAAISVLVQRRARRSPTRPTRFARSDTS